MLFVSELVVWNFPQQFFSSSVCVTSTLIIFITLDTLHSNWSIGLRNKFWIGFLCYCFFITKILSSVTLHLVIWSSDDVFLSFFVKHVSQWILGYVRHCKTGGRRSWALVWSNSFDLVASVRMHVYRVLIKCNGFNCCHIKKKQFYHFVLNFSSIDISSHLRKWRNMAYLHMSSSIFYAVAVLTTASV